MNSEELPPRVRKLEQESRSYYQHLDFIEQRILGLESDIEQNRQETNKKLDELNSQMYKLLWVLIGASFGAVSTLLGFVLYTI